MNCRRLLMIIARQALLLGDALDSLAAIELTYQLALDFQPGSLGGRMRIPARLGERVAPLLELGVGDQQLCKTLIQVDTHPVSGMDQCETAIGSCFRRSIEYRGCAARSGLSSIPDTR